MCVGSLPPKRHDALESIQRFASKICTRNWSLSYHQHLKLLDLDTLAFRRKILKLCFLYQMISNPSTSPIPLIPLNHSYCTHSHVHTMRIVILTCIHFLIHQLIYGISRHVIFVHSDNIASFKTCLFHFYSQ